MEKNLLFLINCWKKLVFLIIIFSFCFHNISEATFKYKIGQKIVNHKPRKYGKTKFGPSRFLYGFLDLITIWFISRFAKRPMHLFGSLGIILLLTGLIFAAYLGYDKLFLNPEGRLITERPEFFISLTTMIIGSQFFSMGFIGELMLKNSAKKTFYIIHKMANL